MQAQQVTSFILEPIFKDGTQDLTEEKSIRLETTNNPFADPDIAKYWIKVYEKAHYECRYIFDPKIKWSE